MSEKQEVGVLELAMSTAYQFEALVHVLQLKGVLTREEVLNEVRTIVEAHKQKKAT